MLVAILDHAGDFPAPPEKTTGSRAARARRPRGHARYELQAPYVTVKP